MGDIGRGVAKNLRSGAGIVLRVVDHGGSAIRGSGSWWHSLGRGGRPPRGLQSLLLEHTALQHLFLERLQGRLDLIVNDRDFQRRPFEAPAEHRR